MTDHDPSAGNAPARPLHKSIQDRQDDAVQLAGCIEAIDLMLSEGRADFGNAIASVTCVARDLANKLANDLDALESEARRNG